MEENKQTNPEMTGAANHNDGEGRHKRRGHRGGKRHSHKGRTEGGEKNAQALQAEGGAPAEKKNQGDKGQKPQGDSGERPEKKESGGQKNKSRGRDRRHGKNNQQNGQKSNQRRDHIVQKDDIYGDPAEERELAEWRARIVLNKDDQKTPLKALEEEAVEIPAGIDLLDPDVGKKINDGDDEKVEVIGIRFRSAGKVYYFDPNGLMLEKGDFAIVETARGPEFGDVFMGNCMVKASETVAPLRPVLRRATDEDIAHNEENRKKEQEAKGIAAEKIAAHKLDMKLIDVQYAFDNSKLLFYFSSEGRVDFRELVKDLASVFRTRIELRQIGIRDEAKMLGGFGACGRLLCCSTFLPDFAQVSIKMAKEQGLSLNSAKISGTCGRLMCCLRFESEVYAAENRLTPSIHSTVKTEDGVGTVISSNPLAGTIRVVLKDTPDAPPRQYHRDNVTVLSKDKAKTEQKSDDAQKE